MPWKQCEKAWNDGSNPWNDGFKACEPSWAFDMAVWEATEIPIAKQVESRDEAI